MQKSSQDPVDPFSLFPHRCENPGILGFLLTKKKGSSKESPPGKTHLSGQITIISKPELRPTLGGSPDS